MTRNQFLNMIRQVESRGHANVVGDNGLAIGAYQQHGAWMLDYWPAWAWSAFACLQRWAVDNFVGHRRDGTPRPKTSARELAGEYNLGHAAPDPDYDARCVAALRALELDPALLDTPVE